MKLFRTIPVKFSVEQNHLPRPYASDCAGMRVGVEGAEKSLHLLRLQALQATPAGVSVEGDFCLRLIVEMRRDTLDETATSMARRVCLRPAGNVCRQAAQ